MIIETFSDASNEYVFAAGLLDKITIIRLRIANNLVTTSEQFQDDAMTLSSDYRLLDIAITDANTIIALIVLPGTSGSITVSSLSLSSPY